MTVYAVVGVGVDVRVDTATHRCCMVFVLLLLFVMLVVLCVCVSDMVVVFADAVHLYVMNALRCMGACVAIVLLRHIAWLNGVVV